MLYTGPQTEPQTDRLPFPAVNPIAGNDPTPRICFPSGLEPTSLVRSVPDRGWVYQYEGQTPREVGCRLRFRLARCYG
jgi:hypothetical protein